MNEELAAPVGLVLGSEATNTQEFKVVLHDDEYLQLDDLVVVRTIVPKMGEVATYGIVIETSSRYEGTSFESDTFRVAVEGTLPAEKSRTATVRIVRVLPETWIAPDAGEAVFRATGRERELALYFDEMGEGGKRALPVGTSRDGELVWADVDFFDGTKGAHMSISGVSGVATKTSYALFFLRCLTAHPEILGRGAHNMRVLIFNVKGEDLLFLDQPNATFNEDHRAEWRKLGIEPVPFESVSFWAPPMERASGAGIPDTSARMDKVAAFGWTPREFVDEDLLSFLFTDIHDARQQIGFVAERVVRQLRRFAWDVAGQPGAIVLRDPPPDGKKEPVVPTPGERVIATLRDLVDEIGTYLDPETGDEPDRSWTGGTASGTASAFMRRLYGAMPRVGRLIRAGASRRIDRGAEAVTVVDIHDLHEAAQRFVVGALIQEVHREKEGKGRFPLSVILLDELNKYAPREGWSPIKDTLVDIAQRGRSLGILLIGAQQTASRVDPDVLANASLRVSGRLDAAEAERPEYGWMLPSTRARARILKPGTMVLSQPPIPAPTVLQFPYPPWATRPEEVAVTESPLKGL